MKLNKFKELILKKDNFPAIKIDNQGRSNRKRTVIKLVKLNNMILENE